MSTVNIDQHSMSDTVFNPPSSNFKDIFDIPSSSSHIDSIHSNSIGHIKLDADNDCFPSSPSCINTTNKIQPSPPPESLERLPNEILTQILHHLVASYRHDPQQDPHYKHPLLECSFVSKNLHALTTPLLWKVLNFGHNYDTVTYFQTFVSATSLDRLSTLAQHIRGLHIYGSFWSDACLLQLLPRIPLLEHLTIHQTLNITDVSFQHVPRHCQRLTRLTLAIDDLTESSFASIGLYCHQLVDLSWAICESDQSPAWLASLLPNCPLQRLKLVSIMVPLNTHLVSIIKKFDRLTSLDLNSGRIRFHHPDNVAFLTTTTTTTTTTTSTFLDQWWWPQLTTLLLQPCDGMDKSTWIRLIKTHPHLEIIDVRWASQLTDDSLDIMAKQYLPKLTHFTMTSNPNITPDGVRRFIQSSATSLVSVNLRFCHHLVNPHYAFPDSTTIKQGMTVPLVELDQLAIEKIKQST